MIAAIRKYREKTKKLRTLREAFRLMKLTREVSFKNAKGDQYPYILRAEFTEEKDTYTFSLPTGVNPDNVTKNSYVLSQLFGKRHEVIEVSDAKNFVLTVYHKEILRFEQYAYEADEISPIIRNCKLPILLGKDEKGRYMVIDMMAENIPHMLIAGASGSGKSTQLRSVLTTLIISKKPIELYLADMKRAEFHLFRNCECVKAYVTRRAQLKQLIAGVWKECERRSDLLEEHEVFNIDQMPKKERLPYIVLCIDEFGVLRKDKQIQDVITDIVLLGRALGVFLILSLQRPDADAVDGDIKTNLNIRNAFRVQSKVDSNIILGTNEVDASKITQSGLMWASIGNEYKQIQAPWLELDPAKLIVEPHTVAKPLEGAVTGEVIIEADLAQEQPLEFGVLDVKAIENKDGGTDSETER